jgi:hypothetical protein
MAPFFTPLRRGLPEQEHRRGEIPRQLRQQRPDAVR